MKEGEPKVIEIIPILRGLPKPALTYFYRGRIEPGEFVNIEVRSNPALGIVSRVTDARTAKAELRKADFALKKLKAARPGLGLSPAFLRAAGRTADYYAATTGAVLGALIPKFLLAEPELLSFRVESAAASRQPVLLQLTEEERFAEYMSIVRESFARRSSVILVAPTNLEARRVFDRLSPGIEDYAYLFSLAKRPKELRDVLKRARTSERPVLFVTTAAGLAFDRDDLGTIIVERESSRSYLARKRPYLSIRIFLQELARETGRNLVLGDTVLSVATLWKGERTGHSELIPLKWRLDTEARTSVVDMKKLIPRDLAKFEIFSPELRRLVDKAAKKGETVFLFGARKGFAPSTVCGDCGNVLECRNCGAPLVLHTVSNSDKRLYICHACGAERDPETRCDHCGSWKLVPLGIGLGRIAEEAHRLWPDLPVHLFDRDHIRTSAAAKTLGRDLAERPKAIVVGTELFLLYAPRPAYAGIVTLDSLFAISDFSAHERIFSLISRVRERTREEVVIQTRNVGRDIIEWAARGNILDFYRREISERETFLYPPLSVFIKVETERENALIASTAAELNRRFAGWQPEFIRSRYRGDSSRLSMIIRAKSSEWPNMALVDELRLLGRDFSIKVDPESIL